MKRSSDPIVASATIGAAICLFGILHPGHADITWSGDIDPADPTTWIENTRGVIGESADGTLTVDANSDLLSQYGWIGYESGSTGQVTIDGTGSTWTNSRILNVGYEGDGVVNITAGGVVDNGLGYIGYHPGSSGHVTVDGTESAWTNNRRLYVGRNGSGTLNVTGGGAVNNSSGSIDSYSGTTSQVTVDGIGSTWTNVGDLDAGGYGYGMGVLSITGGGAVSNFNGTVNSFFRVAVDGTGSTWTNNGVLTVGRGVLNITGGGSVTSQRGAVGEPTNSMGQVTVDGTGSTWTIGEYCSVGSGTLHITGGGKVVNRDGSLESYNAQAIVSGAGSTWINTGRLRVGYETSPTLNIMNDGLVSVGSTLTIGTYGDASSINMSTGGMLALAGDVDDSLAQFLDQINGKGAIRYWDDNVSDWANISGANYGEDYTLEYLTAGDLAGYTLLTVYAAGAVPEPAAIGLAFSVIGLFLAAKTRLQSPH